MRSTLTWVAIQGVPYIGIQLMLAAAPIDVRGAGADFAAVIGGYFQAPSTIRSILVVVGLAAYLASGFWLGRLLGDFAAQQPDRRESLGARLAALSVWRRILAAMIGFLWIGTVALGIYQLFQGHRMGQGLLLLSGTVEWAALLALLIPWRRPGPTAVWRGWFLPALLAGIVFLALGVASSDFTLIGLLLLPPLVTAAWRQASIRERSYEAETGID